MLVQGDTGPGNFMFDGPELTAVIDCGIDIGQVYAALEEQVVSLRRVHAAGSFAIHVA